MRSSFLLAAFSILIFTSMESCMGSKLARQLKWHQSELKRAAESNLTPGEKLDILLESVTKMMDESLQPLNPEKSVKYVQKYINQNDVYVKQILKDVGKWQENMTPFQTIQYGVSLQKKPFIETFIDTLPKFEKKYRQYAFALNFINDIRGSMMKFGENIFK
ncbi:MAG: hypothetical protein R2769_02880 [Saprospiraceae bacterium]